jgi:hypothetical protein
MLRYTQEGDTHFPHAVSTHITAQHSTAQHSSAEHTHGLTCWRRERKERHVLADQSNARNNGKGKALSFSLLLFRHGRREAPVHAQSLLPDCVLAAPRTLPFLTTVPSCCAGEERQTNRKSASRRHVCGTWRPSKRRERLWQLPFRFVSQVYVGQNASPQAPCWNQGCADHHKRDCAIQVCVRGVPPFQRCSSLPAWNAMHHKITSHSRSSWSDSALRRPRMKLKRHPAPHTNANLLVRTLKPCSFPRIDRNNLQSQHPLKMLLLPYGFLIRDCFI